MANFVADSISYHLYFEKDFTYDTDEIRQGMLDVLGNNYSERPSEGTSDDNVRLWSKDKTITIWLDHQSIMVGGWFLGKGDDRRAIWAKTKEAATSLLQCEALRLNYSVLSSRSRGYYFPTTDDNEEGSKAAVEQLLQKVITTKLPIDILKANVSFTYKTLGTTKDRVYGAVRNKETGIFALKIEASEYKSFDPAASYEQIQECIDASTVLEDLDNGRTAIDELSR